MEKLYIAVDFDGTCVTHEYPEIGKGIGAVPTLLRLVEAGHKIILHTMRSGETLNQAVAWFEQNGIPLFGINENPTQTSWTQSPKIYAHTYIDDAALGCPLLHPREGLPYVDWAAVEAILSARGLLK